MKTRTTFALMLTVAIHVIARGQVQTSPKQVVLPRASQTSSFHFTGTPEKEAENINQKIRSYDEQIAQLQQARASLASDINVFFDTRATNSKPAPTGLAAQASLSFQLYEHNYATINALLAGARRGQVTPTLVEQLVQAGDWANSAKLMEKEASAQTHPDARAGAMSNCLEKLNAALAKQTIIITALNASTPGLPE